MYASEKNALSCIHYDFYKRRQLEFISNGSRRSTKKKKNPTNSRLNWYLHKGSTYVTWSRTLCYGSTQTTANHRSFRWLRQLIFTDCVLSLSYLMTKIMEYLGSKSLQAKKGMARNPWPWNTARPSWTCTWPLTSCHTAPVKSCSYSRKNWGQHCTADRAEKVS